MNDLIIVKNGRAFTSTLTIAEGVANTHKAVIQLTRKYIDDLREFGLVTFKMLPRLEGFHGGGDIEIALLNEHQATLLLTYMRNTKVVREFKIKLVKAFFELSNADHSPAPLSRMEILKMAIDSEQEALALSQLNQILTPKANAHDHLSNANGSHSIRDAAKQLKLSPKALCAWVDNNKWCYKNGKNERVAFENRITSGLMTTRSGVSKNGHSYSQPMITTKGLAKLAIIFKGTHTR